MEIIEMKTLIQRLLSKLFPLTPLQRGLNAKQIAIVAYVKRIK